MFIDKKMMVITIVFVFNISISLEADIINQDFEDPNIFVVNNSFGMGGVGDGTTQMGLWKNPILDGNYTPIAVQGNSTLSFGSQCVKLLRNSNYGSGVVYGLRSNESIAAGFMAEMSMRFEENDVQFSVSLADSLASGLNEVAVAYYDEKLHIRRDSYWVAISSAISPNQWFKLKFLGDILKGSYEVYLDVGYGYFLGDEGSFDNTTLSNIAGLMLTPWTQNKAIYLDDVVVDSVDYSKYKSDVQWTGNAYLIWSKSPNGPSHSVPVSLDDWYDYESGNCGEQGVRYILNLLGGAGVDHVWWRTFSGGLASGYKPTVDEVTLWAPPGAGSQIRNFDPLREAVEYSGDLAIDVYAWFTFFEEWHGNSRFARSRYTDLHRDMWDQKSNGELAGEPSFFFEEYRDYKIALVSEMVQSYEIDGLVLDFERLAHRDDSWGYFPEIREAFTEATGLDAMNLSLSDPNWLAFRAQYVGMFVNAVSSLLDDLNSDIELVVWFPWDKLLTAHSDIVNWAENCWMDRVSVFNHDSSGWAHASAPPAGLYNSLDGLLSVPISYGVYVPFSSKTVIEDCVDLAVNQGFDQIVWFESTPMQWRGIWDMIVSRVFSSNVIVRSPQFDLTGGGEVYVQSFGYWTLYVDDLSNPIAGSSSTKPIKVSLPEFGGMHTLLIECGLPEAAQYAGFVIEGVGVDANGISIGINSDQDWVDVGGQSTIVNLARPSVAPFKR